MIENVTFKDLVTHSDDRGFFREIIRASDPFFEGQFGQLSFSYMFYGVIKAWHYHKVQTDWWFVSSGVIRVGMCDMREDSKTFKKTMDFLMGDHQAACVVRIPPGVAHGCRTVQGPAHLFYVTSHEYDGSDEYRIPYDSPEIDFNWMKGPAIK